MMFLALIVGCGGSEDGSGEVVSVDLDNTLSHWSDAIEVVPPVRIPQASSGAVRVFLRLPVGAGLRITQDTRTALDYPPGTVADRVETRLVGGVERVVDVRGTRIAEDGVRWHHVYRTANEAEPSDLVGVTWRAGDPAVHTVAVAAFVGRLRAAGATGSLDGVVAKLDCDGCHVAARPQNLRVNEFGLVNRGTDSAGFFTPSTVFDPAVPLERYGVDVNLADPFVQIRCPSGELQRGAHARCDDGTVPLASLVLDEALAAEDPHALAHVRSLRRLQEAQ